MEVSCHGILRLDEIPMDVLREIFLYLSPFQQAQLALMCRAFRSALQGFEFKALNALRLEHLLAKYRAAPGWLCLVTQHWQINRNDLLTVLDVLLALQEKKPKQLKLESLAIGPRAKLTARDFRKLTRLKCLRAVNVYAADVPPEELRALSGLTQLQELTLDGLKSATLPVLHSPGMRSLQVLGARRLVDAAAVSSCTALEELVLSCCVRLEGLRLIGALPRLTRLSLYGCSGITDSELVYLAQAPNLQELDVTGCIGLSGAGLRALSKLPLQIISAGDCSRISAEGIRAISAFPLVEVDLQALDYAPSELLGDRHLSCLGFLTALESLNLANRISSGTPASLSFVKELTNLESLDLAGCALSVGHLVHLAQLRRLRSLNLSRSRTVNDECMKAISHLSALENLSVVGCPRVTVKGLACLQFMTSLRRLKVQASPNLSAVWFARMMPNVRVEMYGSAVATFRSQPQEPVSDVEDTQDEYFSDTE